MNTLQLYINGERVELFEDESINVTSSIQNSKDISKIFTDFSKDFTVPATAKNNKIFKHYYNYDIVDGFDARVRQPALLQINHFDFRQGKISLMGVSMKNNSPSSYKVVFYGSTVTLPDLFGDDVLPDILELNDYNHEYSAKQVKKGLETSLIDGNIIYPLLTHSKRLYYNSKDYPVTIEVVDTKKVTGTAQAGVKVSAYYTGVFIGSTLTDNQGYYTVDFITEVPDANLVEVKYFYQGGNVYFNEEQNECGVEYTDLKPALKLNKIVNAIERKYGITFSSTFFDSDFFDRLFMWLHRKKGALTVADGETFTQNISNFIKSANSSATAELMQDGETLQFQTFWDGYYGNTIEATFIVEPATDKTYSLKIYDKNVLIKEVDSFSGDFNETFTYTGVADTHSITVLIETSNGLTNYDATWRVRETVPSRAGGNVLDRTGIYEAKNQSLLSSISITQNVPDMKVLDFMTNLFKMFNLTSYVKDDGTIYVETLDTFYSQYKTFDITNYVFTEESTINRALPYNKINLQFPEPKSFIAEKTNQITGRKTRFGNLIYDGGEKFDGTDYTLKLDFEKMVYEKLSDYSGFTNICYGWFAKYNGDSGNDLSNASPEIGKPLIFFNVKTNTIQKPISWLSSGHSAITTYNRPSNVSNPDSEHQTAQPFTLNFGTEVDEFYLESNSNSLYNTFYKSYIERVFNPKGRMFTFKAKLPQKVLLNYLLNDVFIINGKQYVINLINTDLMTGISSLELINKLNESTPTDLGNNLLFDNLNLIS